MVNLGRHHLQLILPREEAGQTVQVLGPGVELRLDEVLGKLNAKLRVANFCCLQQFVDIGVIFISSAQLLFADRQEEVLNGVFNPNELSDLGDKNFVEVIFQFDGTNAIVT